MFTLTTSDGTASSAPAHITIEIVDDVPTANAGPTLNVLETDGATSGTNLLANDVAGADGATLTHVRLSGGSWVSISGSPFTLAGVGVYTFASDGSWSFDPEVNPSTSATSADFEYRITDGDGDTSEALQVINVANANNIPDGNDLLTRVDDEGAAARSCRWHE